MGCHGLFPDLKCALRDPASVRLRLSLTCSAFFRAVRPPFGYNLIATIRTIQFDDYRLTAEFDDVGMVREAQIRHCEQLQQDLPCSDQNLLSHSGIKINAVK